MRVSSRVHHIIDQLLESEGFEDFEFDFGVPSITGAKPFTNQGNIYFTVTFSIGKALTVWVGTDNRILIRQIMTYSGRTNNYKTILRLPPDLRTQHNSLRAFRKFGETPKGITWTNDVAHWLATDQLVYRRLIGYVDIYGYPV